jgi:hypothetical protein
MLKGSDAVADVYNEITTVAWSRRIIGSFVGALMGFVLFFAAFPILWGNEGRSVERIRSLDQAQKLVVEASSVSIDPDNDGKLVHLTGRATTASVLSDRSFGVNESALKLKRVVEMYQWKEVKKTETINNIGGSQTKQTTYSYHKVWSSSLVNSSRFGQPQGHENPAKLPYDNREWTADIRLGAHRLSGPFINQIDTYETYPLSQQTYAAMDAPLQSTFKLRGGKYVSGDQSNPEIGAVRIHYEVIRPADISVIGKQNGSLIEAYDTTRGGFISGIARTTSDGDTNVSGILVSAWRSFDASAKKKAGTIALLEMGAVDAGSMFSDAADENRVSTWLWRLAGFALMSLGLVLVLGPLTTLADFIPLVGLLVGASLGLIAVLGAFVLSFLTISLAWVFYRPFIAGGLIVLAAIALSSIFWHVKNACDRKAGATPINS